MSPWAFSCEHGCRNPSARGVIESSPKWWPISRSSRALGLRPGMSLGAGPGRKTALCCPRYSAAVVPLVGAMRQSFGLRSCSNLLGCPDLTPTSPCHASDFPISRDSRLPRR